MRGQQEAPGALAVRHRPVARRIERSAQGTTNRGRRSERAGAAADGRIRRGTLRRGASGGSRDDAATEVRRRAAIVGACRPHRPRSRRAPTATRRAKARDPDAWIARIRKLRADGDVQTAERELREFREFVPDADARIPADLRAWAATVR